MSKNEARARKMNSEDLKDCANKLAKGLKAYPKDKNTISLNDVHNEFNCVRSVAMEIVFLANKKVPQYFEVLDDIKDTPNPEPSKLYVRGLMLAFANFKLANNNRPDDEKFMVGDKFEAQFDKDDPDKVILTRTHRAASNTTQKKGA